MQKNLSDRTIDRLTRPKGAFDQYSDTKTPGLRLRSGKLRKSWYFDVQVKGGSRIKHTLGHWPEVSADAARDRAAIIAAFAEQGIVSAGRRQPSPPLSIERQHITVGLAMELYLQVQMSICLLGEEDALALRTALSDIASRRLAKMLQADVDLSSTVSVDRSRLVGEFWQWAREI